MYYKRGGGSFKLEEMEKVRDFEHLKQLMAMSDDELPPAARPTAHWQGLVADAKKWKNKGKLKGNRAIAAQAAANERSRR